MTAFQPQQLPDDGPQSTAGAFLRPRDWLSAGLKIVWPVAALALLLLIGAVFIDGFLSRYPLGIAVNSTRVMLLALGMCLVIATGGIDLSVGAVMAITAAVAAVLVINGWSPWVVIPFSLLVAVGFGLWNGFLVAILGIQPIVATLVLMVAGRGIAQLVTGGQIPNFDDPVLVFIGQGDVLGVPFPLILAAGMFVLTALFARGTAVGLMIETVGDNPTTARYVGISVTTVKMLVYAFSGLCAGMAGLVDAALIKSADANNAGLYMELDAIFAVVVGGTALVGGRFYLAGAVVGALLLQTLTTIILALDAPSHLIPLPKAIVIVVVILLQSPVARRRFAGVTRPVLDRIRRGRDAGMYEGRASQ